MARPSLHALLLGLLFALAPLAPAHADGYGWYAYFFDYDEFLRAYRGGLRERFKAAERVSIREGIGRTDSNLLTDLEQSGEVRLLEPRLHDNELLWANALVEYAQALARQHRDTPARYFETGRLFIEPGVSEPCETTDWISGACGAYVMYTPDEVATLFWQVSDLITRKVRWSKPEMQEELVRFKDLLKEAVLERRAIYFYGHD